MCVCSYGINRGLGGPVGSCWEQETGADIVPWCARWLKWDETTWPPEEPINYSEFPATVKLTANQWGVPECLQKTYICSGRDDKVQREKRIKRINICCQEM